MVLAALILSLTSTQERPQFQPISLVKSIIGNRTGRNGYEEYLLAAETLHTEKFEEAYRGMMKATAGNENWLSSRQVLVSEADSAKQLIVEGNRKDVVDPRVFSLQTLYPDLSYLKMVARYLPVQATVEFSQGKNQIAADTLLSGLVYADKLSRTGVMITYLVAQSNVALTLAGYSDNLQRIPVTSWQTVIKHCDSVLGNTRVTGVVNQELDFAPRIAAECLQNPSEVLSNSEEDRDIGQRIMLLRPQQKNQLLETVRSRAAAYRQGFMEIMSKPEPSWNAMEAELETKALKTDDPILEQVLMTTFPVFTQVLQVEQKIRTQLRLLKLHGLIQTYRWQHGVLPKTLEQLEKETACLDPLSGGHFVYEPEEDSYQLYSKGGSGLSRIDIVFKRPASGGSGEEEEMRPPQ